MRSISLGIRRTTRSALVLPDGDRVAHARGHVEGAMLALLCVHVLITAGWAAINGSAPRAEVIAPSLSPR